MRYDPAAYLYASARVRAMEGRLLGRQKLNQLQNAPTVEDFFKTLSEGTPDGAAENAVDRLEQFAEKRLREAFAAVAASVPDPTLIRFLQYPYDCHNLKVLQKCRYRGMDPAPLLIDLGSVPVKELLTVWENDDFSLLPTHMGKAVLVCRETFAKTADPQDIDCILDRAAFADMTEAAAPFPLARDWVKAKLELTNLLLCLRLLRMQNRDLGRSLLQRAALTGGDFDMDFLLDCYDGGETVFFEKLTKTPYAQVIPKDAEAAEAEKAADDRLTALVRKTKSIPFGAEVPVAYLLAVEGENKNLRILLSGKKAGLPPAAIQTRMRDCHV